MEIYKYVYSEGRIVQTVMKGEVKGPVFYPSNETAMKTGCGLSPIAITGEVEKSVDGTLTLYSASKTNPAEKFTQEFNSEIAILNREKDSIDSRIKHLQTIAGRIKSATVVDENAAAPGPNTIMSNQTANSAG